MGYAEIVIPLNLKGTYTYSVPIDLLPKVEMGMRVLVPFRGRKIYTGVVFELHNRKPEDFAPKEILNVLDEVPLLPKPQIEFWKWMSEYYLCHLGEIYRFSFPSSLKLQSETYLKLNPNANIEYENLEANEVYLLQALEVQQLINLSEIEAFIPKKEMISAINSLIGLQYIMIDERVAERYKAKEVSYVEISKEIIDNENLIKTLSALDRAKKQKELFLKILSIQTQDNSKRIKKSSLFEEGDFSYNQLKSLLDKGFVQEYYLAENRLSSYEGEVEDLEELTEAQRLANNEIEKVFQKNNKVLLHGVTSSGKTHIYMHQIERCIAEGKNALLLLPEIALTKQIINRLEKKYGSHLGFYHQKLTDFERVEVWQKVRRNEIKILIGTRCALFLPFQNLGLIVVDEEHDRAYKLQEVSPFFNGRDAALMLSDFYQSKLILGSATPSVETYYLVQKNIIGYTALTERYGKTKIPDYQIINFKEAQSSKQTVGNFSTEVIEEIKQNLEKKKQIIILHNRRGYAKVLECEVCGYATYCTNCDVVMTYHKSTQEMKCHYCGQKAAKLEVCPKCKSDKLTTKGIGVEQIYEEVKQLFPEARIERMDVDTMRKKFAYERLYEKIENRETDIIVGTQMISKGLDFDNIDLVVIPKADALIYVLDFRAEEQAYQLITQISGRAGRVSGEGRVMVQTYNPFSPIFQMINDNGTAAEVYDYFLKERKKFLYPPFTKLVLIEIKHNKESKADRASQFMGSILRKYLHKDCILGPEKSSISKLRNKYQFQILVKLPRNKNYYTMKKCIEKSLEEFREVKAYQSVKIDVFVDF
ncbi:replication restart helicase PriA [Riemerella columbipharyngis]|nr:primosomal protein N' [Riemerella columbipharyngis]